VIDINTASPPLTAAAAAVRTTPYTPPAVPSAVGRRKTAVARIRLKPGSGKITINQREALDYLNNRPVLLTVIKQPLEATGQADKWDIIANVNGGGVAGQAGAIRHGISRALVIANPDLKHTLRSGGYLTRDPRMVERKKYGQPGARKKFQFSKR